jgi:hypothetical protein
MSYTENRAIAAEVPYGADELAPGQIARFTKMLAELDAALDHLTERVTSVLGPPDPEPPSLAAMPKRECSEIENLVDGLHHRVITVRRLTERVVL